jgi:predicted Zn-dependent peptidase
MRSIQHPLRFVAAACALAIATSLSHAQEAGQLASPVTSSVKGVELKGKAPVNHELLKVQLPRPKETTLKNGLRISLLEDHKLPTFSMQLIFHGGGLADPPDRRGLAMITAAMMDEGTRSLNSREIAERLAALGASLGLDASPSSGESTVSIAGLVENLEPSLALLADVVRNPTFPDSELEKFKARLRSQLQYQRSLPDFVAEETFLRAVYQRHPASQVVPEESVLKAVTRKDLETYHATYFVPNNATVIVYGDVNLKEIAAKLEQAFGDWKRSDVPTTKVDEVQPPSKAKIMLIDRPGSVQTSLLIGGLGIERTSPDYFAMLVMNHILGGGPASRLFMNLREDKGYTYGASSQFDGSSFPGVVLAETDVRTDVTEGALHELEAELDRIRTQPVPEKELENAKHALIGRFALSLESPRALVSNLATQKIYGLPADYWDTYPQHVQAITAEDIKRVAAKYYRADRLQIVAVGDATSVRKTLEKYGDVETPAQESSSQ